MQVKEMVLSSFLQVFIEKLASGLITKFSRRDRICELLTKCSQMLANIKTRTGDTKGKHLMDKTLKRWHLRLIKYLTSEANDLLDEMTTHDALTQRSEAHVHQKKRKEKRNKHTTADEKVEVALNVHSLSKMHHGSKLTLCSEYVTVSQTIIECLNEKEMNVMINRTQFGNLIKCAEDHLLSTQLMSFLMSTLVYASSHKEVWMIVHGRILRFSKLEYSLITGLHCSNDYPKIVGSTQFSDKHFNGSRKVSIEQVEAKLREMKELTLEAINVEKLKMACLYFVSSVLRPIRWRVDISLMSLVDDFDSFNEYPWGTVAFVELTRNLKGILVEKHTEVYQMQESDKWLDQGSFNIRGFIHPMQIFAYECIPGIARMHATQKQGNNVWLPGMCRWKSKMSRRKADPMYKDIEADSDKSIGDNIDQLTSTDEEVMAPYFANDQFIESSSDPLMSQITAFMPKWKTACSRKLPRRQFTRLPVSKHVHVRKEKFRSLSNEKGKKPSMKPPFAAGTSTPVASSSSSEEIKEIKSYVDKRFTILEKMLHEAIDCIDAQDISLVRRYDKIDTELPQAKRQKTQHRKVANRSRGLSALDLPSTPTADVTTRASDADALIYSPTLFCCSFLL